MDLVDCVEYLYDYNAWGNERILNAGARLTAEQPEDINTLYNLIAVVLDNARPGPIMLFTGIGYNYGCKYVG